MLALTWGATYNNAQHKNNITHRRHHFGRGSPLMKSGIWGTSGTSVEGAVDMMKDHVYSADACTHVFTTVLVLNSADGTYGALLDGR